MSAERQNSLRNKYVSDPSKKESKTDNDFIESVGIKKKKPKKTFTPVRIEDDILEGFKDYVKKHRLETHGAVINKVLAAFLDYKHPKWRNLAS